MSKKANNHKRIPLHIYHTHFYHKTTLKYKAFFSLTDSFFKDSSADSEDADIQLSRSIGVPSFSMTYSSTSLSPTLYQSLFFICQIKLNKRNNAKSFITSMQMKLLIF